MKQLFLILFLTSCSQLKVASNSGIPVTFGPRPGHDIFTKVEGIYPLYLWGLIKPPQHVPLSQSFFDQGATSVSKLSFSESFDFEIFWKRLITFGMYWPVKWKAEAYVQKNDTPIGLE